MRATWVSPGLGRRPNHPETPSLSRYRYRARRQAEWTRYRVYRTRRLGHLLQTTCASVQACRRGTFRLRPHQGANGRRSDSISQVIISRVGLLPISRTSRCSPVLRSPARDRHHPNRHSHEPRSPTRCRTRRPGSDQHLASLNWTTCEASKPRYLERTIQIPHMPIDDRRFRRAGRKRYIPAMTRGSSTCAGNISARPGF